MTEPVDISSVVFRMTPTWEIQVTMERSWLSRISRGILVIAFGSGAVAPSVAENTAGDAERGKAVVVGAAGLAAEQACVSCHGVDGRGDAAAVFPRLAGQSEEYLLRTLTDFAAGRRRNPIMAPIASALSQGQRRDAAAYYASLQDQVWTRPPPSDGAVLQYGAALAAVGSATLGIQGCINCHGPAGRGLPPTTPYLAGQPASYLAARLTAWRDGAKAKDATPANIMAHVAGSMGEREIKAVSEYFAQIPPDPLRNAAVATGGQAQ